ncbi:MAG: hypothetical protein IPM24_20735 [Bryobacterales bacterium]|nr:hypothetical protein [Bryobacterales bacterium]
MRHWILCLALGGSLALPGSVLEARDRFGYERPDPVIRRVMSEIRMVSRASPYVQNDHQRRLMRAHDELARFDLRLREGRYERRRLDRAIDHLKPVARSNRIDSRTRHLVERNIVLLRQYRAADGRMLSYAPRGRW